MKVGFIGLGHMGTGMAANLLKAGHEVTVYNRTRAKADELVAQGGQRSPTRIADACKGDVVMTMLANDEVVESVVYGDAKYSRQPCQGRDPHFLQHDQRRLVGAVGG